MFINRKFENGWFISPEIINERMRKEKVRIEIYIYMCTNTKERDR
jgi:hypothetical protein